MVTHIIKFFCSTNASIPNPRTSIERLYRHFLYRENPSKYRNCQQDTHYMQHTNYTTSILIQHNTQHSTIDSTLSSQQNTYRVSLGLHESDAIDTVELLEESGLGGKFLSFPVTKLVGRQGSNDLKVEAATAYDTFDRLDTVNALDFSQDAFQGLLGLHQGSLVGVRGPLASPFTGNRVELDTFCDGDSDLGRRTANECLVGAKGLQERTS
jgi:hypothetical protein